MSRDVRVKDSLTLTSWVTHRLPDKTWSQIFQLDIHEPVDSTWVKNKGNEAFLYNQSIHTNLHFYLKGLGSNETVLHNGRSLGWNSLDFFFFFANIPPPPCFGGCEDDL